MNRDTLCFNENRFFKRRFDGEWMIADLKSGDYFTIDGEGALIFDAALEGEKADKIAEKISKTFPEEPLAAIRNDVDEFIRELVRKKILI